MAVAREHKIDSKQNKNAKPSVEILPMYVLCPRLRGLVPALINDSISINKLENAKALSMVVVWAMPILSQASNNARQIAMLQQHVSNQ